MRNLYRPIVALPLLVALATLAGCATAGGAATAFPVIGSTTVYDPSFHEVVGVDARIEKLSEGFTWAEGPAWMRDGGYLLFNDVPENTLYRWTARDGLSVFLKPSGLVDPDPEITREAGANGLYAEPAGTVLLADSGTRVVARLDPATKSKTTLAATYEGKRFNSPNDLVRRSDGPVFFTDPPYGLKGMADSPARESKFSGVYRVDTDGSVHLLDDDLDFPNGIALSPDERTLYVANSDPARPIWMAYTLDAVGAVADKRVFADASDLMGDDAPGLPDGMAVAANGTLFATGPGGLIVFTPDGKRLGRIETGKAVSNVAFGDDGRTLYMTSSDALARVRVLVTGAGFPTSP